MLGSARDSIFSFPLLPYCPTPLLPYFASETSAYAL